MLLPGLSGAILEAVQCAVAMHTSPTMSKEDFIAVNGISASVLEKWIATPTCAAKVVVKRERLELLQFSPIRKTAEPMPTWCGLAMDLALVTGQRREDLTQMQFDHVVDGRLQVEQGKTGTLISLPLDLELKSMGLQLGAVIDHCQRTSTTEFLLSAGIRKNSPDGSLPPDGLTKKFVAARKASGLDFEESPPTFHEIRSLAGRLYEK
ncbi:hypothetical protein Q5A_009770 [Serratia inhibens PRI-2C]|nr:hypothetical protein Q5A_009770 [Serratia inhibens PRI-2C]